PPDALFVSSHPDALPTPATPLMSRKLVPELPQSRTPAGARRPSVPGDTIRYTTVAPGPADRSTVAPRAATMPAVERTSAPSPAPDRKSTRLNSSHEWNSY